MLGLLGALATLLFGPDLAASPQKPTFRFEACARAVGQQGPNTDKIDPDDFIAVCGGGGPVGSPAFTSRWKDIVERCRKGFLPGVTDAEHARGFLYIKGQTVSMSIDCDKAIDIAAAYGVVPMADAAQLKREAGQAAVLARQKFARLESDASAGRWEAQFFLATFYLGFERAPVPLVRKYEVGMDMVEALAKSGHGDVVLDYVRQAEAKGQRERNFGPVYTAYQVQVRLAKAGHGLAAMRVCEIEVVQARLNFANPPHDHSDVGTMAKVSTACERAADLNGPAVRGAVDDLKKQALAAQQLAANRRIEAQRAQAEALGRIAAVLGSLILSGSSAPAAQDGPIAREQERQRRLRNECIAQRDAILDTYSAKELGFAGAFLGCP